MTETLSTRTPPTTHQPTAPTTGGTSKDTLMTLSTVPAPARSVTTEVEPPTTAAARPHPYRKHGLVLTTGAVAWSITIMVVGTDPVGWVAGRTAFALSSGLFQVGLFFLLRVMWRTRPLGQGRLARAALVVEHVVLSLALLSTISDGLGLTQFDSVGWTLLDLCWPASMLGMFLIAVRIAVAGRWRGLARYYPLVAESWAIVTVPSMMLFGAGASRWVGSLHLLVGYAVLGLLVSRKTR